MALLISRFSQAIDLWLAPYEDLAVAGGAGRSPHL